VRIVSITAVVGLITACVWYITRAVSITSWEIPGYAWGLMIFGSLIAVGLGVGLMAILFYSSRHGDDEAAQYHQQDTTTTG
jgi:hypothetical protein